jgi:hypothetical protein
MARITTIPKALPDSAHRVRSLTWRDLRHAGRGSWVPVVNPSEGQGERVAPPAGLRRTVLSVSKPATISSSSSVICA